ncbi:hypothetical protein GOBAR_DD01413 [Gossypium barbadense]|nr:hypothetical protein GOBAR_DD01413 [Gossypium barbadense]
MFISLWILDDCGRPLGFLRIPLSGTSSKVVRGTFHVDRSGKTGNSFSQTRNVLAPSIPEINSIGPRWYTGSMTDGLSNSKHFQTSLQPLHP